MEQQHVRSIEGSPRPEDIFEPHMPGVELMSDMDGLFRMAREQSERGEFPEGEWVKGRRSVAIVTPGRLVMFQPCPLPGSMSGAHVEGAKELMPPDPPLKISVVSYTLVEAFMEDETKLKVIPFLGFLIGFAYIGHNVVVFEGHPTAFESGVRDADVLIIDSGMLPFIQEDWFHAARRVMRPGAKIFVHQRKSFTLLPVAPSVRPSGWRYTDPDGEASYANCLLTLLARGKSPSVRVTSGLPLPDLAGMPDNPDDLDWVASLPFKYDRLDADKVIEAISGLAKWGGFFQHKGEIRANLALEGGKLVPIHFALRIEKDKQGRRQLLIER